MWARVVWLRPIFIPPRLRRGFPPDLAALGLPPSEIGYARFWHLMCRIRQQPNSDWTGEGEESICPCAAD
jgi:hypothetical protein